MPEQLLDIEILRIDGDTQPRMAVDEAVVAEYAEDMKAGAEFPPVRVVTDGAAHWLVDGFHRYYAHRKLGRTQIRGEVTTGLLTDAQWMSLAANRGHGLRRSNADKSKALIKALAMRPDMSDRNIAEHIGVSTPMVSRYRLRKTGAAAPPDVPKKEARVTMLHVPENAAALHRTGMDGKRYPSARAAGLPVSPRAFTQIRDFSKPDPMTALNMPHDPVMGARTLIEVFKPDYLRALVDFLQQHLKGLSL